MASVPVVEWLATFNQKRKIEQGKVRSADLRPPSSLVTRRRSYHIERSARHRICRKRGSGEGRTTLWLWHMRWLVWLGNIMEMYRTANPGMTVRPRPWPRRVASSTELESIKWHSGRVLCEKSTDNILELQNQARWEGAFYVTLQ